ncbi:MAG: iron-sulfur cluster assembly protein [Streptosporangiaceae bacterium]
MTGRVSRDAASHRARRAGALRDAAWSALSTVRDPELDRPVTDLGFVAGLSVEAGVARVRLRLPTFFCAPNFAYLMVADARDALAAVPDLRGAEVRLEDHFAAEEINTGAAAVGGGFVDTFPGLADGELAELRRTFASKAHLAAQERLARRLGREGWAAADLSGLRLGDVPASTDLDRVRRRRVDLGLSAGDDTPVFTDDTGRAVPADELPAHLRFARAVRVSVDGNADWCQGLLSTRYGTRPTTRQAATPARGRPAGSDREQEGVERR